LIRLLRKAKIDKVVANRTTVDDGSGENLLNFMIEEGGNNLSAGEK